MTIIDQTKTQWHSLSVAQAAQELHVNIKEGLATQEATNRLQQYGPNRLAEKQKETKLQSFLRQYKDFMQIILVATALISLIVLRDYRTTFMLLTLTILNAILGMSQEAKAEASLSSLRSMLQLQARVRRNGQVAQVPADDLIPGDIVLFEAGDKVPADGRLLEAATLEIEEAALTGESTPVLKNTNPIDQTDVPLGDRLNTAYMNTTVTRGRGVMLVTGTGMNTEIGHIAAMMNAVEQDKTPLQKQLDRLTIIMATVAGMAFLGMTGIGLARGLTLDLLVITGVSMAIAAVPTGLPAVVTTVLSLGTSALAKSNAIVKRLTSVETLGSTSAICSDKTGTLTLNQMTVREISVAGHRFTVEGRGYSTEGAIRYVGEASNVDIRPAYIAMALDTDAVLDGETLIGDPTEGALIVLAEKGGVDVKATRDAFPRIAEVPFDSEYKLMATFHNMKTIENEPVVRVYVKGAPDVLLERSTHVITPKGGVIPLDETIRQTVMAENNRLAAQGMRVLAFAGKHFDPDSFAPGGNLLDEIQGLALFALVGIVDPPRPEAKQAIAEAHQAGIQIRVITGGPAVTAAAVAREVRGLARIAQPADAALVFAGLADKVVVLALADFRHGRQGARGGPRNNLAQTLVIHGDERRTPGADDAGHVWADGRLAGQQLKSALDRGVEEGAALDHHRVAQHRRIVDAQDLFQAVADDRVGQAGGQIADGGALSQELLDPRIHEHRAARAELAGHPRRAGLAGEIGDGDAQDL